MLKPMCSMVAAAALLALSFDSNALITEGGSGPDCSDPQPSTGVIWPPDHSMVQETIVNVTDPGGLEPMIVITGIRQDEPVLTQGSGNTQPDGTGVGTSTAYIRAERAGPGTGRYYYIYFTASDANGMCTGMVQPYVPHDQGQGFAPTDLGPLYDSTVVTTD